MAAAAGATLRRRKLPTTTMIALRESRSVGLSNPLQCFSVAFLGAGWHARMSSRQR
jgi:hypothetical protein